jgi:Tat protein translocase TatB subunit
MAGSSLPTRAGAIARTLRSGGMFGLGGTEVLVVFVLALLLFGPRKLPEIGQMLGKTMSDLRRATMDFRTSLEREVQLDKLRETGDSLRRDVLRTEPAPTAPRSAAAATPQGLSGDEPPPPDASRRETG